MRTDTRTWIATTCLALTAPASLLGTATFVAVFGLMFEHTAAPSTSAAGRTAAVALAAMPAVALAASVALVLAGLVRASRRRSGTSGRALAVAAGLVAGCLSCAGVWLATGVVLDELGAIEFMAVESTRPEQSWGWSVLVVAPVVLSALTAIGVTLLSTRPVPASGSAGAPARRDLTEQPSAAISSDVEPG